MQNLKSIIVFLLLSLVVAFGFQNCGKVKFSKSGDDGLVAIKGDGPDDTGTTDNPTDDDSDDSDDSDDDDNDDDSDDNSDDDSDDNDDGDDNTASSGQNYICILESGRGKSEHIGYASVLTDDINTPRAVCMSKHACEVIAAEVFPVMEAAERGFCPNKNPHVFPMSDEEVQSGIDQILSQQ